MLNEMIDIFLGMYNHALELIGIVPTEYEDYTYFCSLISLIIPVLLISGSFALLICVVSETFQLIRGAFK